MYKVIFNHPVTDFGAWIKVFEAHPELPRSAGFAKVSVWQAQDDPNNVYIMGTCNDLERVRKFAASAELKQAMQESGVQAPPTTHAIKLFREYDLQAGQAGGAD